MGMAEPSLSALFDVREILGLLDAHPRVAGVPSVLLDPSGTPLAGAGWFDLCGRIGRPRPAASPVTAYTGR
jgi:hypothetical protein